MRFIMWFLYSAIFVLPLEAAENPQALEAVSRIESFLDEKEASAFYLDSRFLSKDAVESDKLRKDIGAFKVEIIRDPNLTKECRLGISRQLIQAFINLGKHKEALELCKDFSERYPESKNHIIRLYCLVGDSSQRSERYDQAIESYQQALLYDAKDVFTNQTCVNLGWCYYKKGEYEKAINEYSRSLQEGFLDSGTMQWAWFETGRCRFFLKDYEDATEAFKQALKVNKDTKLGRQAKTNIEDIEKLKRGGTL